MTCRMALHGMRTTSACSLRASCGRHCTKLRYRQAPCRPQMSSTSSRRRQSPAVLAKLCFAASLLLSLSACSSLAWYKDAIGGQLYILTQREKIDTLLADP